ncbi:MAG TPA: IclR family transcriptional regulator [Candidatus Sulfotelmatobacter sp.]|nr:IclR family transcriptional regulator [Candidatus Sulfotelmatobacter sp.]
MHSMSEASGTAVDRALSILEATAERAGGLTNSEISRRLGMPKSSASYILRRLEQRGYLRRDAETGKYRPGLKILSLGREVLSGLDIRSAALPLLRQLVERTELTAHLAVLDHGEAVYVERVDAPGFIKMDTWVGRRMCVHSTGVGKALIATLSRSEIEALAHEHPLTRRTPNTITSLHRLLLELDRVRERGYAVDDEENNRGARCVAAPVSDGLGRVAAAVGLSGTAGQIDEAALPRLAALVTECARRVGRQLGRPLRSG